MRVLIDRDPYADRPENDIWYTRGSWPCDLYIHSGSFNHRWEIANTLGALGRAGLAAGNPIEAAVLLAEGLLDFQSMGTKVAVVWALEGLASVRAAQAQLEEAARLLGAAQARRRTLDAPLHPAERATYDQIVTTACAQLGDAAFAAAWSAGCAMSVEQAITYALEMGASDTAEPVRTASSPQ